MPVTALRTESGVLVAVAAVPSVCRVAGFYAQQLGDKSFCVEDHSAAPVFETFQRRQGLQDMRVLSIGRLDAI